MENCLENLMVSARTRQVNEATDREQDFRPHIRQTRADVNPS
jgi:hypothetical protein